MPSKQILLIEDEDDIREIAAVSLECIGGWTVAGARSGEEGLLQARRLRPDAVLLDVMMPDMDGPTTLQRLQSDESTKSIPVIFMTAKVQDSDTRRYLALGAKGVIPKPFDPMTLAQDVSKLLGW